MPKDWDKDLIEIDSNIVPPKVPYYVILGFGHRYHERYIYATTNRDVWEKEAKARAIARTVNKDSEKPNQFICFVVSEMPKVVTSVSAELK